jgi:hypothetical protein
MPENKGLDRGGAGEPIGKNREGSPRREQEQQPDKNQPLPGTIRNPDLEEKKKIQPTHEVD